MLVAAAPLDTLLGLDRQGLVRVVGAGLLLFALDVALVARTRRVLPRAALVVSVVDSAWVLASIALVAAGAVSLAGAALTLAVAAVVAMFAALQVGNARTLLRTAPS